MTRVETIEREIENLSQEEFEEIREWILDQGALLDQPRKAPLKELLLAETPRAELPVLPRRRLRRRSPEALK